jgi:hypothetical protein
VQVKRIAANSCDAKLERSFIAISRCQAAQQKAEKRLGGVPRKRVRLSEASAIASSTPQGGINFGQSRFAGPSGWLPFWVRFWANCQSSAVLYADKNEQRTKYIISYLE